MNLANHFIRLKNKINIYKLKILLNRKKKQKKSSKLILKN